MSQPNITNPDSGAVLRTAQSVVARMLAIIEDPQSTLADRQRACNTIRDALQICCEGQEIIVGQGREQSVSQYRRSEFEDRCTSQEQRFWDTVQQLMKNRNVTQAQLAERLDVSQPSVSQMLSRRCRPQRSTIVNIAAAFDVPAQDLWPDLDVADILDSVAAFQEERVMSDAEANAIRATLERNATDAKAAPLPKWER